MSYPSAYTSGSTGSMAPTVALRGAREDTGRTLLRVSVETGEVLEDRRDEWRREEAMRR